MTDAVDRDIEELRAVTSRIPGWNSHHKTESTFQGGSNVDATSNAVWSIQYTFGNYFDKHERVEELMECPEFTSGRELREHYAQVQQRMMDAIAARQLKPEVEIDLVGPPPERPIRSGITKLPAWRDIKESAGLPVPPQEPLIPPTYVNKIRHCFRFVARHYNVEFNDLISQRRTFPIVRYRQTAMYLVKQLTLASLPTIGRKCGGRDHTTVLHAVRATKVRMETDPVFRAEVEQLITKCALACEIKTVE